MKKIRIDTSNSSFREVRENQLYYVDKTDFIEEFITNVPRKASVITRPRRFGKSLTMSMLAEFFDMGKDSSDIFSGLKITENRELCALWMNKYPVISLNFKRVDADTFSEAVQQLMRAVNLAICKHQYVFSGDKADAYLKEELTRLKKGSKEQELTESSLQLLCLAVSAVTGKKAIILIDEYDVPLATAQKYGYYEKMQSLMRCLLGNALKDNDSLKFCLMTGCLRIAKESTYTGLNNLKCYSIADAVFADKIGFTSDEVSRLLDDAGLSHKEEEIRAWYDGYCFGGQEGMYCPWDVLQYIDDVQNATDRSPEPYWVNTSSNDIVSMCFRNTDADSQDLSALLQGDSIEKELNLQLTYDQIGASENNLWTLLYLTGYLTGYSAGGLPADGMKTMSLHIPNREVHILFERMVGDWFADRAEDKKTAQFYTALWDNDAQAVTDVVTSILMDTISYFDYREMYYHAIMAGLLRAKYLVSSNYESGLGRADIIVRDNHNSRCAVIEIKHASSSSRQDMEEAADKAVKQIQDEKYTVPLRGKFRTVVAFGMVFNRKSCLARSVGTE